MKYLYAAVNVALGKLQAVFPPNRLAVILTPLVFAPAAGFVTAYVAQHFPGLPQFSTAEVTGFFAAGFLVAATKAAMWLKGWRAHEAKLLDIYSEETAIGKVLENLAHYLENAKAGADTPPQG